MQQLTGLDAEFLAMESPAVYGHVGSVCLLDPSTAPAPLDLERLTSLIASRLHLVPLFRRRVIEVPLGLDHPYWVDDPDLSLDYHVREIALPAPGDDVQLTRQVARLHARPLDRAHPLWEIYLISGLRGGRVAVYSKIHHAAMDGIGGDDLLVAVLDPSPAGRKVPPAPPWRPEPLPSGVSLLGRSAASLAWQPVRAAKVGAGLLRHAPGLAAAVAERLPLPGPLRGGHDEPAHPGLLAPHTPFNAQISPHRRWAFADLSLPRVKQVKNRAGVTVNDVVMALTAGALRHWLLDHDALPDDPLIAAVPISIRTQEQTASYGNKVSAILARLPTDVADPWERLAAAAAAMTAAKHDHSTIPPTLLADATGFANPLLAEAGWRLAARLRLMERVNPWNLFVSNVPGPRVPLYYAGARLLGYFPISAIAHGQGLNITAMSYLDRICFGLLACRSLVPDLDVMAGYLGDELDLLDDAARG
jgi:WS/DGAT/MGAT family acyltransferase